MLLTFFISAINAPISWKKAQLGHRITWCGWTFHLDIEALRLVEGKLAKLRDQLEKLAKSKKILRKHLESSLGLLMWATSTCQKDLHSGQGTLHQVFARDWQRFVDSLTPDAVVSRRPAGLWIPAGSKLLEVGSVSVQSKQDVPRVPPSHKPQWVRLADPARTEIHLRNESRHALLWLSACFQHDQLRTLRQSPLLHCMAAADAMAEGDAVGIGGWISTSTEFLWFSESWCMHASKHLHSLHWQCSRVADCTPGTSISCFPLRQITQQRKQASINFSPPPSRYAPFSNWSQPGLRGVTCNSQSAPRRREECLGRRAQQIQASALCKAHCRPRTHPIRHVGWPARRGHTAPPARSLGTALARRTALDLSTSLAPQRSKKLVLCLACTALACS